MADHVKIAIIGSGPAGLSAGARAAALDISHIVLERAPHLSDTVQLYQRGKLVMATPYILPTRGGISFEEGSRESVLGTWQDEAEEKNINFRLNAEVTAITHGDDQFLITINGAETLSADHVVLAFGLQGNIRKLNIDGANWEGVQYQLDDPRDYVDETIAVIGAGDSGIENALGLMGHNKVILINRRDEFVRAKEVNRELIEAAIKSGRIDYIHDAIPTSITPGCLQLEVSDDTITIECDRIIARLGANPPRHNLEKFGVSFCSDEQGALPELSPHYETCVPGLYIIGTLGGYPLIKHAVNQGYEVIDFILGRDTKPADEPLIAEKLKPLLINHSVDEALHEIQNTVPLLSELSFLQLREFVLESKMHHLKPGETIFKKNDYTDSLFIILKGNAHARQSEDTDDILLTYATGEYFGEIGLIAGRRRVATVTAGDQENVFLEASRHLTLKWANSIPTIRETLDHSTVMREFRAYLSGDLSEDILKPIIEKAEFRTYKPDDIIYREGEDGDGLHIIRKGSVTISKKIGGKDVVLAYLATGNYVGEMSLLNNTPRTSTVKAAVETRTAWIDRESFLKLVEATPSLRQDIERNLLNRLSENESFSDRAFSGNVAQFLIEQGFGEATDMLLIDESLCIRCDNCETACAVTHGGTSRLDRRAGATMASLHVPTSCRHCEHPHCMADCPPDAIHRSPNGEVFIDDTCIGCGNCVTNCPYDVVHMADIEPKPQSLWWWMLFGVGSGPSKNLPAASTDSNDQNTTGQVAVKCDMCKDITGGPACVRACPTGAAARVSPEEFFALSDRS